MIRKHTRRAVKAAFCISFGVAIVLGGLAAGALSAAAAAQPTVKLGTKNFTEEYVLGQLYKQALEAKGFKVAYHENIGSTEIIDKALTSGKINVYPEYTGDDRRSISSTRHGAEDGGGDVRAGEGARGEARLHAVRADAVLRHGRDGRARRRRPRSTA